MMVFDNSSGNELRLQRVHDLKSHGVDPYAPGFEKSCNLIDVRQDFSDVSHGGVEINFELCGRVSAFRLEDGMFLVELEEQQAQLQCVLQPEWVGTASLEDFRDKVFTGDYVGFSIDKIYRLRSRELAVRVRRWVMLAPCLIEPPIDEPFDGDLNRHLHMAVDRSIRRRLMTRSKVIQYIRRFLEDQYDYLETAIPAAQPDIPAGWRGSYLKRLLVGGIEAVYEIAALIGEESVGWCGYPQSQLLDSYKTLANTSDMMRLTERLVCELALEFYGNYVIPCSASDAAWREVMPRFAFESESTATIKLNPPWPIHQFHDLVQQVTGINFLEANSTAEALRKAAEQQLDVSPSGRASIGAVSLDIARRYVFPTLIQPAFVRGYPAETHSTSRRRSDEPRIAEHFELYINGLRRASGDDHITDPREWETLLNVQNGTAGESGHGLRSAMESLIHALKCGLPPTTSLHLSIDRLVMLLTNADDIRSVVYFPSAER